MSKLDKDSVRGKVVRPDINPTVRLKPHIGNMMADAYTVAAEQFRMWRERVMNGEPLDSRERSAYVKFVQAFTQLAKEEREQEKREDPAHIGDAELVELVEKARKVLKEDM